MHAHRIDLYRAGADALLTIAKVLDEFQRVASEEWDLEQSIKMAQVQLAELESEGPPSAKWCESMLNKLHNAISSAMMDLADGGIEQAQKTLISVLRTIEKARDELSEEKIDAR